MKLGFHYHAPAQLRGDNIFVNGFIGVFIDSIADECDVLVLLLHSPLRSEESTLDYRLKSHNLRFIDIGPHIPLYFRILVYPWKIFRIRKELHDLDHLLIRSPTPIMFDFVRIIGPKKVSLYLVSDYLENSKALNLPYLRKKLIQLWAKRFQGRLVRLLSKVNVVSNSEELRLKLESYNNNIRVIRTSTLSADSFYRKKIGKLGNTIRLVYTGRIDLSKGLIEMVEAMGILHERGIFTQLSIAGWDTDVNERNTQAVKRRGKELGLTDSIYFLGKKQIGHELNEVYREGDIYLICSQFSEGFPRTVWEAMANSLPVVATNVGSLPYFLKNEEHAMLIEPKNSSALAEAIQRLVSNEDLREKLVRNGFLLAEDNTLESQAKRLISQL